MLVASPHPSAAQGTCSVSDGTNSETVPDGNPPEVTKTGQYDEQLDCKGLANGLKLTLDDFKVGTSDDPADERGLIVNADGAEGDDVTVMGKVVIHSDKSGINLSRDGTGLLKLQLDPESEINIALSDDDDARMRGNSGIFLEHSGEADTALDGGIHLVSSAKIDVSKSLYVGKAGIAVRTGETESDTAEGTTIPITIHLKGGFIRAEDTDSKKQSGNGIRVIQYAKGKVDITVDPGVMIGMEGKSIGRAGIDATIFPKGDGNLVIKHSGHIYADEYGIYASLADPGDTPAGGDITIETGADSVIDTSGYGIAAYLEEDRTGTIKINHYGKIKAGAQAGIHAQGDKAISITMEAGSRITATEIGLRALAYLGATATVETKEGSVITADHHGVQVDQRSPKQGDPAITKFTVTIRGTVMGGATEYAGVHIFKRDLPPDGTQGDSGYWAGDPTPSGVGGTIVIGPRAHVSSFHAQPDTESAKKVAIKVDAGASTATAPVTIILEKDEAGVVGHVEGQILNLAATGNSKGKTDEPPRSTLEFKVSGSKTALEPGAPDAIIYRRGQRMGVYEQVFKAKLEELDDDKGYQFKDVASAPVLRLYSHRARLYEVVPSVLLGLVELTPYSTRMAMPRRSTGNEEVMVESSKGEHVAVPGARTGVWVRLAVRDGERMADTSTTATDFWRQSLAWDVKQTGFEAGLEVPTDERLVLGVSAHYRQSEATVRNGGTMEASGTGVGVSLTWTDDSGLYVDGQLSYTRFFDITMVSANGAVGAITSTGGGTGLAFGVEVGQPMSMGGMTVIPRGGLSWSSVDMDAFDEPARIDGAGRVAPDKEQSVQGRVGVLAELGSGEADGRLYASLDLEHEFSSKRAVMVAGTRLTTEVKPTWVRLGVGGAMSLGGHDTTLLTGDAFYATAGSDNTDFGGGVSLTFRF